MFGSLGIPELLLIFAVILIVFGPRRIPEIGRMLGKAMGEFRKATDDLKSTIEREVRLEELKSLAPSALDFTTPYEAVSRSAPPDALKQGPEVVEPSSRRVDPEVFESSSLPVVEEQTQPRGFESSSLPVDEEQTQPQREFSTPLEDLKTRRLEDSPAGSKPEPS